MIEHDRAADDVTIHFTLKQAGVTLVSTSENIDETPSGMLMHGIMSSIAEFYSRNLANEVTKGLVQKASLGGTVSRAPLGYRNVHVTDELGRVNRTVEIDPERAHLITWAFYRYAEGDCSLSIMRQGVYELYWYFAAERQHAFERRVAGQAPPWSGNHPAECVQQFARLVYSETGLCR